MTKLHLTKNDSIITKLNKNRVNLDAQDDLEVLELDPLTLIDHRRFDIIAKYIYGWFKENNIDSEWGKKLYEDHIWVFNQYDEDDGSGKKGIHAFFKAFHSTLNSVKEKGFDDSVSLIPISKYNVPLDGAHRLTAALLYKEKVKVVKVNQNDANYNYEFFGQKGLLSKWSDAIAYEYCKLKQNIYIIILFPNVSKNKTDIKELLSKYGNLYYEKEIKLNKVGIRNLFEQYLEDEEGLRANLSHVEDNSLNIFVYELNSREQIQTVKEKIENLEGFYFSNSTKEMIRLAQVFLNDNSIHFLNHAKLLKNGNFNKLLNHYKRSLIDESDNIESFCLISNAVMSVYGITDSSELSYISYESGSIEKLDANFKKTSKNYEMSFYKKTKDDILFNPENHFYHDGIKFATLQVIKEMKDYRRERGDVKDVRLIKKYVGKVGNHARKEQMIYNVKKKYKLFRIKLGAAKLKFIQFIKIW